MKLSVLDQSTASQGRTQDVAIRETLALARHCERLGYHRYWVSEHHSTDSIVGTAPEILVSAIAATTERIRVGSAGVMLPHYSSLKVAEQFRVIEAIAPGRIDLGLGRAPGSDQLTSYALNPNLNAADEFPRQVFELRAWINDQPLQAGHPFASIKANPRGPTSPEIWILGSSDYGAHLAAHFGLPYAFAYFFSDGMGVERALEIYRSNYKPSERHPEPQATICVWALAADTEEAARRLARTREHHRIERERGLRRALQSPDELAGQQYTHIDQITLDKVRRKEVVGTGEQVAEKLDTLARQLALEELAIVTWTYEPEPRHRSYELLARAFNLSPTRKEETP